MVKTHTQLGQLFIEAGIIDNTQLEDALMYKSEHNVYLGRALSVLRMVSDDDVIKMVSHQLQIPWIDPLTYKIRKNTLNLIGEDTAKRLNVIPLYHLGNVLTVACADQNNVHVIDELTERL